MRSPRCQSPSSLDGHPSVRCPYESALLVLGFPPSCPYPSASDLKKRWRKLCLQFHPDKKCPGNIDSNSAECFLSIKDAYTLLKSPSIDYPSCYRCAYCRSRNPFVPEPSAQCDPEEAASKAQDMLSALLETVRDLYEGGHLVSASPSPSPASSSPALAAREASRGASRSPSPRSVCGETSPSSPFFGRPQDASCGDFSCAAPQPSTSSPPSASVDASRSSFSFRTPRSRSSSSSNSSASSAPSCGDAQSSRSASLQRVSALAPRLLSQHYHALTSSSLSPASHLSCLFLSPPSSPSSIDSFDVCAARGLMAEIFKENRRTSESKLPERDFYYSMQIQSEFITPR